MKDKIEQLLKDIKSLKEEFKEWCKDKTIPLDERWEVFIKSDLGDVDGSYINFPGIDWNHKYLYDDFHIDKYATLEADEALDIIHDNKENFDWNDTKEIKFKEFWLSNFKKGFINDW